MASTAFWGQWGGGEGGFLSWRKGFGISVDRGSKGALQASKVGMGPALFIYIFISHSLAQAWPGCGCLAA